MNNHSVSTPVATRASSPAPSKDQIEAEYSSGHSIQHSIPLGYAQKGREPYAPCIDYPAFPEAYQCQFTIAATRASCSSVAKHQRNVDREAGMISLTDLAYLRRLRTFHGHQSSQAKKRLIISRTSWTVRDRLIQSKSHLLRELSKALRSENQKSFLPLFQAFLTTETACNEYDRNSGQSLLSNDVKPTLADSQARSFLHHLSTDSRDALMHFLHKLASSPDFLIHNLLCLNDKCFDALFKDLSSTQSSILRDAEFSQSTAYKAIADPGSLETFLEFGRHDFLSTLTRVVGLHLRGPTDDHCVQYWARTCAALLLDKKSGSEAFLVAMLNTWSDRDGMPGLSTMEKWLLEVLKDGDFLLDKPDKYSFRARVQPREKTTSEDADAADAFFVRSMNLLLTHLMNNPDSNIIPTGTLKLGQAVVGCLRGSPAQYRATPYYMCTRWLFSSYLANIIKKPESHGLLLSYHVSTNARRRILDQVASRLQKLAFDVEYTWNHTTPTHIALHRNMQAVVSLFFPGAPSEDDDKFTTSKLSADSSEYPPATHTVVICPSEILTLLHGMFPESMSDWDSSAAVSVASDGNSATSSTSGFSGISNYPSHHKPSLMTTRAPGSNGHLMSSLGVRLDQASSTLSGVQTRKCDLIQDRTEEDVLVAQLKDLREELTASDVSGLTWCHRDPFCEPWATVCISRNCKCTTLDRGLHDSLGTSHYTKSKDDLGFPKVPSRVKDAINLVLVHLESANTTSEQRIYCGRRQSLSNPEDITRRTHNIPDSLINALSAASMDCRREGNIAKARSFRLASYDIKQMPQSDSLAVELTHFVDYLARDVQDSIDDSRSTTESHNFQAEAYLIERDLQLHRIQGISNMLSRLREKMWYIHNVRFSSHYEDLSRITSALRTMGLPDKPIKDRCHASLRRRPTLSGFHDGLHIKTESAILDLLAAPPGHGGPNKLSDKQVTLTSDWLKSRGVEIICHGEERLHRFCQEVSICVEHLVGNNVIDHPVLWSSELFRDLHSPSRLSQLQANITHSSSRTLEQLRALYECRQYQRPSSSLSSDQPSFIGSASSRSSQALTSDTSCSATYKPSPRLSGSCSPTLTNSTCDTMWSSFSAATQTSASMRSFPSRIESRPLSDRSSHGSINGLPSSPTFLEELKNNVTSLLLSDLGKLFQRGSETDLALSETFSGRFGHRMAFPTPMRYTSRMDDEHPQGRGHKATEGPGNCLHSGDGRSDRLSFDPVETFRDLFRAFPVDPSPYRKLKMLCEIHETYQTSLLGQDIYGTEASTAQGVRMASEDWHHHDSSDSHNPPDARNDVSISLFRRLLGDKTLRPTTLFRDLQYIAALVPKTILESNTEESQVFWSATIAASSVKGDMIQSMIETADAIVTYHTATRGHSSVTSPAQAERDSATFTSSRPSSAAAVDNISQYTMADAAHLYLIAAKEGEPVAQRELATLHLTHPELMKRVIAPMTKASDVFKGTATDGAKGRKSSDYGLDKEEDGKYDPVTIAIARHWMELAAKGGDELAKNTLKATDEIERIP